MAMKDCFVIGSYTNLLGGCYSAFMLCSSLLIFTGKMPILLIAMVN